MRIGRRGKSTSTRMGWGIWCLVTEGWVYDSDPDDPCVYPTRGMASTDLKNWCLRERLKTYEVRKMT